MSELVIYRSDAGSVEVRLDGDTVWLRQEQMSQLFGRDRTVIGRHLRNVFADGELDRESNVQNLHIPGSDGQPLIDDIALTALTLLIAESDSARKDTMTHLVMNLLSPAGGTTA